METNISLKQINTLAIPAIIAGISEPILSLTDAAIVGHMSLNATESLAAVGVVTTFLSMIIWVLGQSRSAISSIISQYVGANKLEEVKDLPAQAIVIILGVSLVVCGLTYPFSTAIFKLYNASGCCLSTASPTIIFALLGCHSHCILLRCLASLEGFRTPITQCSLLLLVP
ncbi:MATE family efflux transporter [Flavobacteriaceae bacterium]|nr:MATE family efflux transporter [Flavobacteriaceae bacterium]